MNISPLSIGENRLLNISARQIREEALARQKAQADATRASQAFASTGGVNPNATAIQEGIKTNFDYDRATPEQRAEQDRLMGLADATGTKRVTAAPTPSSLTTGARGIAGATGDTTKATDTLGEIDKRAIDRLMHGTEENPLPNNMSYEDALKQVQSLRPSIQGTTSTTGLSGTARTAPTLSSAERIQKAGADASNTIYRSGVTDPAEREAARVAAEQAESQKIQAEQRDAQARQEAKDAETRRQASTDTPAATGGTTTGGKTGVTTEPKPNPVSESNKSQFQQLQSILNSNPVFAGSDYAPILQAMMSRQSSVDAEEIRIKQLADFQKSDADFSGATDAVERAAAESKRLLTERTAKEDAINQRHLDIAKETAEINKSMQEFEKQKFEINQQIREQQQAEANIENEQRNRRIANKMGIETDTQGLKFMRDEVRKGKEALQRLSEFGDAQRGQYALQIGRQYSLDVNNALLHYDEQQLLIDSNFASNLKEIDNTVSMDAKERRERKDAIWKEYWDTKKEQDKEAAATLRDVGGKMLEAITEDNKSRKKDLMSTKDTLGFVSGIRKEVDGKQVIKDSKEVDLRFSLMKTALADFKSGRQTTATAVDQALITIYNKMLDPSSVVRESEYARTPSDLALWDRLKGGGAKQFISGGAGLTNEVREDLVKMAERFKEAYDDKLAVEIQPFILDIDSWNASYPDSPISYSQVFDVNSVHLPQSTMGTWEQQFNSGAPSRSGLGADSSLIDFFSVYAPAADNNNPTSYARIVANDLGVTPDTPIGELRGRVDEFAKSIAKHEGFTSGASRLAVVNNNPGNLRFIGQAGAVQGEGGFAKFKSVEAGYAALRNDILAKMGGRNATIASAPKGSTAYSLVPTANAESPDDVIYFTEGPSFVLEAEVGPDSAKEKAAKKKQEETFARFYPNAI